MAKLTLFVDWSKDWDPAIVSIAFSKPMFQPVEGATRYRIDLDTETLEAKIRIAAPEESFDG